MRIQTSRFSHLDDAAIEARLIELRERVTPILANNLLPHFTDHSVTHSDSLVRIVDQLIEPLQQSTSRLTPDELQILYSACYLHDIGMQYENADKTQVISNMRLPQSWSDLSEDSRRTAEAAYVALARNKHLRIPESLWHQLIYSLTMAAKSPLSQLRRAAAYTIRSLRDQSPDDDLSERMKALEAHLAIDICYSVRSALADRMSTDEKTES